MSLAGRLEIGVAPWRDPDAVRATVVGWVRDSLDSCTAEDREVFVAVDAARLVGVVTVGQRQHFTGETDAYVGELVVAEGMERRGVGTLLMQAAEEWGRRRGLQYLTLETRREQPGEGVLLLARVPGRGCAADQGTRSPIRDLRHIRISAEADAGQKIYFGRSLRGK